MVAELLTLRPEKLSENGDDHIPRGAARVDPVSYAELGFPLFKDKVAFA